MDITKEQVQEAITFLETIPDKEWTVGVQENTLKQRCAVGQLGINPKSPFYDRDKVEFIYEIGHNQINDFNHIVYELDSLCSKKLNVYLVTANNIATPVYPQATPKARSIAILTDLLTKMD